MHSSHSDPMRGGACRMLSFLCTGVSFTSWLQDATFAGHGSDQLSGDCVLANTSIIVDVANLNCILAWQLSIRMRAANEACRDGGTLTAFSFRVA